MAADRSDDLLTLTADIVVAHVAHNEISLADLPGLISSVHRTLGGLGETASEPQRPAVPIRSSVKPDHIVCLEDGRKLKMLKRYLMDRYGMTPDEYRAKWNLPADYPMAAPNYSATRKALAERNGLGRKSGDGAAMAEAAPIEDAAPAESAAPAKRRILKPLFLREEADTAVHEQAPSDTAAPSIAILRAAIARRTCVTATYNKRSVLLAPHIIFTKHGEPHLRAVTVEQEGRPPRELKLGTFKLVGLGALAITARPLVRFPGYPAEEFDYGGDMICAVDFA